LAVGAFFCGAGCGFVALGLVDAVTAAGLVCVDGELSGV
jgi:hypothetical protein